MARVVRVINPSERSTEQTEPRREIDWKLCILCRTITSEPLVCPANSKRKDAGAGYKTLALNLSELQELDENPFGFNISELESGEGIEFTLSSNNACWHKSCRNKINSTEIKRVAKRKRENEDNSSKTSPVKTRRSIGETTDKSVEQCLFCDQSDDNLHKASTFEIDDKVRKYATELHDTKLLSKLAGGDMVAIDAVYHTNCLVAFYNRARKKYSTENADDQSASRLHAIAFAEVVSYIEGFRECQETVPVFTLVELSKMYSGVLEDLGVNQTTRIHSSRLREKLETEIPDLLCYKRGRDVVLAFDQHMGDVIMKTCERDNDSEALHLARAARIIRRDIFNHDNKLFDGSFPSNCQARSVPASLKALISMILDGPCSSKTDSFDEVSATTASLSISQIISFNCVKKRTINITEEKPKPAVRHNRDRETPLPTFIGLKIYAETRSRSLIDAMSKMGLSISYDRVMSISTDAANSVCSRFEQDGVVCPPKLREDLFTTGALDNIDHNPSATTAKDSFHGTAISLVEHPTSDNCGKERSVNVIDENIAKLRRVQDLPDYYTSVQPVVLKNSDPVVPKLIGPVMPPLDDNVSSLPKELDWLNNVKSLSGKNELSHEDFMSWAAFHASLQSSPVQQVDIVALLPLFLENSHSSAMIRHGMNVVNDVVQHLNPGQTPVIAMDQPLFALAKLIQWNMPETHGEDRYVVMFGGLHVEMAAFKVLGEWLDGSGWVNALIDADVATPGTAESFLKVSHLAKTRRAHEITAAALYVLQQSAYDHYKATLPTSEAPLEFNAWCGKMASTQPQFTFWSQVLELEILILEIVRATREGNFNSYVESITALMPWMFALDHVNYARWLSVHVRDMATLHKSHPSVYQKFTSGAFVVQKSKNAFSAIALDQAHEQENASIKGEGGAVGLTENPSALRRWMIGGPEIARMVTEYEGQSAPEKKLSTKHHEQVPSVQNAFLKNVKSLVSSVEDLGNPFKEDSGDLLALDTKDIMPAEVVESVQNIKKIGQSQYKAFVSERMVERTKPITHPIKRNKLPLFSRPTTKSVSKKQAQVSALKDDCLLFSRLNISCQTREGDLEEFFRHENQPWPPSLSQHGQLRQGNKAELVRCLQGTTEASAESPQVDVKVFDGAVVVQMLHPKTARTFQEYTQTVFLPYIQAQLQSSQRLDIVWDTYQPDSLKTATRENRGSGARRRVAPTVKIPPNWKSFLRVADNKTELFGLLGQEVTSIEAAGKDVYSTYGSQVVSNTTRESLEDLQPCNHEEADTRIFLHVLDAAKQHHRIMIRTIDTDVFVLAVSQMQRIPQKEVWLAFGMGKLFRYYPIHEIARSLGPQKSLALPVFHAFTGCDTVSFFAGKSKKSAWDTWNVFPEVTSVFLEITNAPSELSEECTRNIETFVVLLYDRGSELKSVDEARQQLFCTRSRSLDRIPPTSAALKQHIFRASYQGGHVWSQVHLALPELPSPAEWGWERNGQRNPVWTTLPQAQQSCYELIHCSCKKACRGLCKYWQTFSVQLCVLVVETATTK